MAPLASGLGICSSGIAGAYACLKNRKMQFDSVGEHQYKYLKKRYTMYKAYTLAIDNINKLVWLALMIHWLADGTKIVDIFK
jgi:hypothetical protein